MTFFVPVVIAAATLVTAAIGAFPTTAPGETMVAVFPPWWGPERAAAAVAAADGLILSQGAVSSVLVIRPDHPDTVARLRDHGAVLVVGSAGLGGCLPSS